MIPREVESCMRAVAGQKKRLGSNLRGLEGSKIGFDDLRVSLSAFFER